MTSTETTIDFLCAPDRQPRDGDTVETEQRFLPALTQHRAHGGQAHGAFLCWLRLCQCLCNLPRASLTL